ncbi:hypothetical protein AAVH_24637 [Aphelenchoides avenae]|nr:hypothetical protein AAVH_24637 [Aphelenchus avenae]
MKSLYLWLNYHVVRHCSWTFLCRDDARELRLIMECVGPSDRVRVAVEEFVQQCVTLPHTRGGKPLELDLTKNDIPGAFGLRIIEMLENSGREVTFRMTLRADAELALDESDYTVVVDGATKSYASKRSRIAVEVEGRLVTIQRIAEASRARAGANEEVLRAIPFVGHRS